MNEKRFTIDEEGNITDTETDRTLYVENRYTACNYYVNLLNELNDESRQLRKENQRLKEGILWGIELSCKNDPKSDIEFWCQQFFNCNYNTAKEKYGTLSKIMKIE